MPRALPSQPRPSHVDLQAWAVEWHSRNRLDGDRRSLQWDLREGGFLLFRTRQACRDYIEAKFGYIRNRPDLQREPHGWRMPQAVKVRVQRLPRGLALPVSAGDTSGAGGGSAVPSLESGITATGSPGASGAGGPSMNRSGRVPARRRNFITETE